MARPSNNNPRRRRGRRPNGKGNGSVDSSGPSVKVRGSAKQVYDKYLILARDAKSSGDSILSESYFQHAEHYARILIENGKFDTTSSSDFSLFSPYKTEYPSKSTIQFSILNIKSSSSYF